MVCASAVSISDVHPPHWARRDGPQWPDAMPEEACLGIQQTQKSFSMIALATPRAAPVSPKRACRSERLEMATLSIDDLRRALGNRHECRPHPGRRLACGLAEQPFVTDRQPLRGDPDDVARS